MAQHSVGCVLLTCLCVRGGGAVALRVGAVCGSPLCPVRVHATLSPGLVIVSPVTPVDRQGCCQQAGFRPPAGRPCKESRQCVCPYMVAVSCAAMIMCWRTLSFVPWVRTLGSGPLGAVTVNNPSPRTLTPITLPMALAGAVVGWISSACGATPCHRGRACCKSTGCHKGADGCFGQNVCSGEVAVHCSATGARLRR
jgi:hypothetical protein